MIEPSPRRLAAARWAPVVAVGVALAIAWYGLAIALNAPTATAVLDQAGVPATALAVAGESLRMARPVLPAPDQIAGELVRTVLEVAPGDPRGLLFHILVTAQTALAGFALGAVVGVLLAVGIVHVRVLDASLMPWIVASQTVPILAIAPMAVVILGNLGLTGLLPKAVIAAYLSFFPVTVGAVKGLRSTDRLVAELLRTYSATPAQLFWTVRLPTALPFLLASFKVAIAVSTVGAIVAELPTGGTAGLGARLLTGSYYGQTLQIWAALVASAVLSLGFVLLLGVFERAVLRRRGQVR